MHLFIPFLLVSLISSAIGDEVRISNVGDFILFKDNVNGGTNYEGTTVLLDADLSLADQTFEPIGNNTHYFSGVFDGQGHMISNLAMNPSSVYTGLFGYSKGLIIRNAIFDSSCSFTSSYNGYEWAYVGGFAGHCYANNGPCTIENSVNMGSVSFTGNVMGSVFLGGIAGHFISSSYVSTVKNCANYGDVTYSGPSEYSKIGGIVGESYGASSTKRMHIFNSINYGTIISSSSSYELRLGGIAGLTQYTTIDNCVSAGSISISAGTATYNYIGSVVGDAFDASISYCYTTSELSDYNKYGDGTPSNESNVLSYDSSSFKLSETVSVGSYTGTSLIDALNAAADYYFHRDYSHWILNKNKKIVTFTISDGRASPISMNYQIILTPSLASEGSMYFYGWYEDSAFKTPLAAYEATSDTTLYGKWGENTNSYTITFDTRREGVTVAPITAQFGSVVTLQSDSIRYGCSVMFWENEYGDYIGTSLTVPAHNITLYAVWKCTHLKTLEDFTDFSNYVKGGTSYSGTTIFLDTDMSFDGNTFKPIGNIDDDYFLGVFDGQGHVISNLVMNSSSVYAGLFGYSKGLTIRNVILDSSCSIASSINNFNKAYVGGFIGECEASSGPCTIENNVNMGNVSFYGIRGTYGDSYIGGIAGYLSSPSSYEAIARNCANYGDIIDLGWSRYSRIGGIVGYLYGSSYSSKAYVYNSINYGTITRSGRIDMLELGGIVGETNIANIENCVSTGSISSSRKDYVGSILGHAERSTSIINCYVSSELSSYNKYCYTQYEPYESNILSYDNTTFKLEKIISVGGYTGIYLINVLNAAAGSNVGYSHWLLNKNKNAVTFTINGRPVISLSYQVMLLPSLASEGSVTFDGWYEDNMLTTSLTSYEVASDTSLYGGYGDVFTVTFDENGGESISFTTKKVAFNDIYGELPSTTKTRYLFTGWFTEQTEGEKVESRSIVTINGDHTLYAHWIERTEYTLTFEVNGGSEVEPITQNYSTPVTFPKPTRTGYTFAYWCSDPELTIEYTETLMPAADMTLYAKWTINQYTITFDFGNGTVSSVVLDFNAAIEYPESIAEREGFTFAKWDSNITSVPAEDIIITAQWTANQYTITFDFKDGTVSSVVLDFNSTIEYPENVSERVGFTFNGWSPKPERMPADDITVKAQWVVTNPTECVEIVFSKKDMSESEARKTIEEFVPEGTEFNSAITEYDSEETTASIRFADKETAKEFVETVIASSDTEKSGIKKVGFVPGGCSLSSSLGLSTLIYLMSYLLFF